MPKLNRLKALLIVFAIAISAFLFSGQAFALEVGSLSEIEGDASCGIRKTGGTAVYAETANNRVYICTDREEYTEPRYLLALNRFADKGIFIRAENPRSLRFFEFPDPDNGYNYILQIPLSQIPNPVFAVELPNGLRFEEEITRYLTTTQQPQSDNDSNPLQTVKLGSKGQNVKNLQQLLKRLGFDPGVADGIFGAKTKVAVIEFQRKQNIPTDGVVGPKTWAKLQEASSFL
ncbi:peptidoglycan-binding protein [Lyngbya aestuarii]|uniref:peptidoglycan-binding protein n=1 Tax=Lyngbya aestuarii TaxID=118322 RepID=UPI00403D7FFD